MGSALAAVSAALLVAVGTPATTAVVFCISFSSVSYLICPQSKSFLNNLYFIYDMFHYSGK